MKYDDIPRSFSGPEFKKMRLLAIEKARQTIPAIKHCFLSGLPVGNKLFVTIEVSDGSGRHENAYVAVNSWQGNEIIGNLATELCTIKAYAFGELLKFSQERVVDWTITMPDGTEEGNHLGKLFDTLVSKQDDPNHGREEPVKIEDFIQSLLELIITAQPVDVLSFKSEFDTKDLSKIQAELNNFRVVLLFLLLFDKPFRDKVSISEEDMGFEIGRVVAKKAAVARHSKILAIEDRQEWMNIYLNYLQAILAHGEKELAEKGIYFYACVCFAAKIFPGMNPMVESERLKNFALVDAAKQVYTSIHKVFVTAQKTVRIQPYVARHAKQSEITNNTPGKQTKSGGNVGCGVGKDEVIMSDTDRLFCKTPGCSAPHMHCDAGTARALLQAQLRTNPNQKYKFDCERCSKTTEYSYFEIMQRIPVEKRPKPCPEGEFWAFVLL